MINSTPKPLVLAGDIGGTKTNLGIFSRGADGPVLQALATYSSRDSANLEDLVSLFLEKHKPDVTICCFGIAGPVINGQVKTTNLPWKISEAMIKERFGFNRAILVNDLVAAALSLPILKEKDLIALNQIECPQGESRALIAPGTGLGMCLIPWDKGEYLPQPSEGGHVDFGPNSDEEIQLHRYLHNRFGHVSCERIVSGSGLVNIYNWLKDTGHRGEPEWLAAELKNGDPARVISVNGMTGKDQQCEKALDMFVSIFGSVAGNLALTGMATGGIFLGGGIPPKIVDKLKQGEFMQRFIDKGRYRGLLETIPVKVILNDKAPLLGAAYHALKFTN